MSNWPIGKWFNQQVSIVDIDEETICYTRIYEESTGDVALN